MGLDRRLESRFKNLEHENRSLRQEVNTLKHNQVQPEGNPVRRSINSLLRISTLGKIAHKELYMPSDKISPVGPRFRKRR